MKIAWVTRSFLDYRLPVFRELDALCGGGLRLCFSGDYVPPSVQEQVRQLLGPRAQALRGEWRAGREDRDFPANRNLSLRIHPGVLRFLWREKPDVMVCDGFFKWTSMALLYRLLSRTPLVVLYERTAHTERAAQWYRRVYRRIALHGVDAMGCSGARCREYAIGMGMPATRITTGHMTTDVETVSRAVDAARPGAAALREALGLNGQVFIAVGRLLPLKGCRELASAWTSWAPARRGECSLLIVGDGPCRSEIEAGFLREGIRSVRFAGEIAPADVPRYLGAADVMVHPSLEDNWSLAVIEAMAAGLPVAASVYNGSTGELVVEGETGWPFDPRDREAFVATLDRAWRNAAQRRAMGGRARELALRACAPRRAAESILDACRIAVSRRRP